jgi:putative transposase
MSTPPRRADPLRMVADARTFFVTSSTHEKRNLLQSDRAAELFLKVLHEYRGQGKYRLHEFVVMPDHFHLLLTLDREITIERAVQFIKGGFAFRASRELRIKPFWQKGFSEVRIDDRQAFARMREYIHDNPVKRRLATTREEYPFSSACRGFDLDSPPAGLVDFPVLTRYG